MGPSVKVFYSDFNDEVAKQCHMLGPSKGLHYRVISHCCIVNLAKAIT